MQTQRKIRSWPGNPEEENDVPLKLSQYRSPQYESDLVDLVHGRSFDTAIKALPCGHYSLGETPCKYMEAWHISRFLAKAFAG
jgi:hypothetical protein